ncbi:MAG: hypothetical protein Q4E57_08670 [Eubacteriales bacterium]|nr:hypothetical protein [Eubacteriales bacterium]
MSQSVVAGIILILFGLILEGKPIKIWQIAEKWKSREATGPSDLFTLVTRILGGVFCILGILLLLGVVK